MSFHDLINIVSFHFKKISFFVVATIIATVLFSYFILPLTFKSDVKLLPPENNNESPLGLLLGGNSFESFISGSFNGNSQLYAEIIKSRAVLNKVIVTCKLNDFWGVNEKAKLREKLRNALDISVNKEGIINIVVSLATKPFGRLEDNENLKLMTAKVANSVAKALDEVLREKMSNQAGYSRKFIERQIKLTEEKINKAGKELNEFQVKNKTISIPDQLRASLDAAAKIKGEIIFSEIKLAQLRKELKSKSPALSALQEKINALKSKYNEMASAESENDYLPPFDKIPELSFRFAELTRELKILNEVYSLLQKEYYKELINENKRVPVVQVLDDANLPVNESKPRIVLIALTSGVLALIFVVLFLAIKERKIKELKNYA